MEPCPLGRRRLAPPVHGNTPAADEGPPSIPNQWRGRRSHGDRPEECVPGRVVQSQPLQNRRAPWFILWLPRTPRHAGRHPRRRHEDAQRSLPVAPAVVVDYTPGRDSIEITRRLHCPAGVLEQLSRCRAPPLAMLAHCAAPDLRPALETSKDQVRLRPYQIRAAHV